MIEIDVMKQERQSTDKDKKKNEHPLAADSSHKDKATVAAAHEEAEKDMEKDADLTSQSPNDDLDEGESARLGENETGLI